MYGNLCYLCGNVFQLRETVQLNGCTGSFYSEQLGCVLMEMSMFLSVQLTAVVCADEPR